MGRRWWWKEEEEEEEEVCVWFTWSTGPRFMCGHRMGIISEGAGRRRFDPFVCLFVIVFLSCSILSYLLFSSLQATGP